MYAQYDVAQINGSALDPQSVMLYSFPASWTLNGFHTDPNEALSALDRSSRRESTRAGKETLSKERVGWVERRETRQLSVSTATRRYGLMYLQ